MNEIGIYRAKLLLERKSMLKQQALARSQKYIQLSVCKRLILIASILLLGGAPATLIPSQTVYAQAGWSQPPFTCWAGPGGNGGIADHGSSGANGGTGGECINGSRGGDGGQGGQNNSPGGPGASVL